MTRDEHHTWLEARHAAWQTPPELLDAVVRRAAGAGVAGDARIVEGEVNEVHAVTTGDGQPLVVRIGRRARPAFEHERWPVAAAWAVGLPAPEILLTEHHDGGDECAVLSFQVQRRLPGSSIQRQRPGLAHGEVAAFTTTAGRLLARLHTIEVPGAGPVGPDGTAGDPPVTVPDVLGDLADRARDAVPSDLVDAAVAAVEPHLDLLDGAPLALVHGDWSFQHLLVDAGTVTGIVDWESARGADPAEDVAWWDLFYDDGATATDLLLDGYREVAGGLDDGFYVRRRARCALLCLGIAVYFADQGRSGGVAHTTGRLTRAVELLRRGQ